MARIPSGVIRLGLSHGVSISLSSRDPTAMNDFCRTALSVSSKIAFFPARRRPLVCAGFLMLGLAPVLAFAQTSPDLGEAAPFAVLGTNVIPTAGTVTCTDTGPGTVIDGDIGTTSNGITNTGCSITGTIDAPVAAAVVTDFNAAYIDIDANVCTDVIPTVTTTLAPGVYCSAAGTTIGAGVTLTLDGTASDVWIFRVGTGGLGALTLTGAQVVMAGGAEACNVFWKTADAATLTDSDFVGTLLSGAAISMTNGAWFGRALATTDVALTDAAPLTFAGCSPPASITVAKDFSDNSVDAVSVNLSCSSGTVIATPLNASEASPAVFTVAAADVAGAVCTATEVVPVGYIADESDCADVSLGDSCTVTNTLALVAGTITVNKDFSPDSADSVTVSLVCTSGTVVATPLDASEAVPAVFNLVDALPGVTCTATELVPAGYVADESDCLSVALNGSCTITNTLGLLDGTITINKDFVPDSAAPVSVSLSCTSGTVAATPLDASEAVPAVFTVNDALPGVTCTAIENVPLGYTANQTDCQSVGINGSCTITNALDLLAGTITVSKDFVPDSSAAVSVSLACTSGTVTQTPLDATEAEPAVFALTGANPGTTCTATETVPSGYIATQADCLGVQVNGSCTIVNTQLAAMAPTNIPLSSPWILLLMAGLVGVVGGIWRRK